MCYIIIILCCQLQLRIQQVFLYKLVELIFTNICTANAYSSGQRNTHDKNKNLFVLFLAINIISYIRLCTGLNCNLLNFL